MAAFDPPCQVRPGYRRSGAVPLGVLRLGERGGAAAELTQTARAEHVPEGAPAPPPLRTLVAHPVLEVQQEGLPERSGLLLLDARAALEAKLAKAAADAASHTNALRLELATMLTDGFEDFEAAAAHQQAVVDASDATAPQRASALLGLGIRDVRAGDWDAALQRCDAAIAAAKEEVALLAA